MKSQLFLSLCVCAFSCSLMFGSEKLKALFGLGKKIGYKQVYPRERSPLETDPFDADLPSDPDDNSDPDTGSRYGFSGGESSDSADSAKQRTAAKGPNQPTMQDQEEIDDDDATVHATKSNSLRITTPQEYCLCNAWICSDRGLERKA